MDNAPCTLDPGTPDESVGSCCEGSCISDGICGVSLTINCWADGGCPSGEACSTFGNRNACAPVSCVGKADGHACAIVGLVPENPAEFYSATTECCGGACVDLESDPLNCGVCGLACPAGTGCVFGRCESLVQDCALAETGATCALNQASPVQGYCCGTQCLDLDTLDNANCGWCGYTCAPGTSCNGIGDCAAPDGGLSAAALPSCSAAGDYVSCMSDTGVEGICCGGSCATNFNFATCATCGYGCPGCLGGCPTGTACTEGGPGAGSRCALVDCGDKSNGDPCAFGPNREMPGPPDYYSRFCCSGACVDVTQDPNNCGSCGVVCPSGICADFYCMPTGPDADCLQSCGPWAVCVAGVCANSSCEYAYCAAEDGQVGQCVSGGPLSPPQCIDFANDPDNCGGIGYRCPSGGACSAGVCAGTPPECAHRIGAFCDLDAGEGYVCCPGVGCTNIGSDPANCGECGTICPAGTSCQGGSCG